MRYWVADNDFEPLDLKGSYMRMGINIIWILTGQQQFTKLMVETGNYLIRTTRKHETSKNEKSGIIAEDRSFHDTEECSYLHKQRDTYLLITGLENGWSPKKRKV